MKHCTKIGCAIFNFYNDYYSSKTRSKTRTLEQIGVDSSFAFGYRFLHQLKVSITISVTFMIAMTTWDYHNNYFIR